MERTKGSEKISENMSVNKIKSLKLQRYSESADKLEDTPIAIWEDTKMEGSDGTSRRQSTPVHSTPKRTPSKSTQDQSDLRASPMLLPCTQDGGNEVAWDWQSPLAKSTSNRRSRGNGEHVGTPKRTTVLQKKRNSNSPLLYKPIKRKLMKSDNQRECIEIFTAEMKALSEQIKTKDEVENRMADLYVNEKREDTTEDELLIKIDIADFTESKKKHTSGEKVDERTRIAAKTSLDDLFDDSIEDSMVKCSQEVEEKLRLENCRGESFGEQPSGNNVLKDFSWHQQSYTSFLASKENSSNIVQNASSSRLAREKSCTKNRASTSRPSVYGNPKATTCSTRLSTRDASRSSRQLNSSKEAERTRVCDKSVSKPSSRNDNNIVSASKPQSLETTQQSEVFEIPDDSFDEDFLDVCFDDVETNTSVEKQSNQAPNQSSSRYGKFYTSPHSYVPSESGGTRKFVGSTAKKLLLPPPAASAQTTCTDARGRHEQSLPRSTSNGSLDGNVSLGKSAMIPHSQSSATMNTSRKFFKTKSLSTSNFDESSTEVRGKFSSLTTTSSCVVVPSNAKSWKNNLSSKKPSVSSNTIQERENNISSCTSKAGTRTCGERNDEIQHFNRNAPRDDGNRLKMINDSVQRQNGAKDGATSVSQSTQICTPEEIERKRREAKMKLEMKRKLQSRSKSAGVLTNFTTNGPSVKR